jgi:hypothetical protein
MTRNSASIVGLLYDARLGSATAGELNRTPGQQTVRHRGSVWSGIVNPNREAPSYRSRKRSGFSRLPSPCRAPKKPSRCRTGWRCTAASFLFTREPQELPHIPATLVFGESTPGIVTAVLINLPIMSILLFQAVREQWGVGDEGNRVRSTGSARDRRRDFRSGLHFPDGK